MEAARVLRRVAFDLHHNHKTQPKHRLLRPMRHTIEELRQIVNKTSLNLLPKNNPSPNLDLNANTKSYTNPNANTNTTLNINTTTNIDDDLDRLTALSDLQESIAFAETLSLSGVVTLLIEIVARLDRLLDALMVFQEQAGFNEPLTYDYFDGVDDEDTSGDIKINMHVDGGVKTIEQYPHAPSTSCGE